MATNLLWYSSVHGHNVKMDTFFTPPINSQYTPISTQRSTVWVGSETNAFVCDPGGAAISYDIGDVFFTSDGYRISIAGNLS